MKMNWNPLADEVYISLGKFAMTWAHLEVGLDVSISAIWVGYKGKTLEKRPPVALNGKIEFLRKAFNRLPELAHLRERGTDLLNGVNELKQLRHDITHGACVRALPAEGLRFMRFVYLEDGHTHSYPEHQLEEIVQADERAKKLCETAMLLAETFVEMIEDQAREITARKAAITLGAP